MGINWVTFFAQIINLFVLVWLLKKFLYRPILKAVEARQAQISERVNKAKEEYDLAAAEHRKLLKQQADFEAQKQAQFDALSAELDTYKADALQRIKEDTLKLRQKMQTDLNRESLSLELQIRTMLTDNFIKMMTEVLGELTETSALEQSIKLVQERLRQTPKKDMDKIKKLVKEKEVIYITSSDSLSKQVKENLALFLSDLWESPLPLKMHFEVDNTLLLGIEIKVADMAVEWNLKNYLDAYQNNLTNALSGLVIKE